MICQLHINGHIQVEMRPENEIERLVLSEMLARSGRGQAVLMIRMENPGDESECAGAIVSVEK